MVPLYYYFWREKIILYSLSDCQCYFHSLLLLLFHIFVWNYIEIFHSVVLRKKKPLHSNQPLNLMMHILGIAIPVVRVPHPSVNQVGILRNLLTVPLECLNPIRDRHIQIPSVGASCFLIFSYFFPRYRPHL